MLSVALLLLFSLAVILTEGGVSVHNPFYCYSQDPVRPQIGMFSAITAYETSRGRNINPNVSTCRASKFWMLSRHGTRLYTAPVLTNIFEHYERLHKETLQHYDQGRTSFCASDIELLKNWKFDPDITFENENYLTLSGWNEFEGLAQRYQSAFPSLLSSTYSPQDYFFRTTNTQRTRESLRAFADGLFGVNGSEQVQFEDIPEPDFLLRAYYACPLYINFTAARNVEKDEFLKGPEYQEMTSQVSAKLGFHRSHALRNIEIEVLFYICQFEQIWDLESASPFCAFFSVANHQVYEYYMDLHHYYLMGYGYPEYRRLIENINCFIMQDMLRFLQSNDPTDHKARIFNTHIPALLSTLVIFGAFEDDSPLTRHNFAQQVQRLWKQSLIGPMGANLAVIRYDCADDDNDILFLYNEKPLQISGCEPNGLCKQSFILERFNRFLDSDCMEVFCSTS